MADIQLAPSQAELPEERNDGCGGAGEITLNLATCFSVALLAFHSRLEITEYCQASLCMLLGCEQLNEG